MWEDHQKLTELPLTEAQADRMLKEAVKEVRRTVTGRKFINLYGPLGAGVESIPIDNYKKDSMAEIDLEGKPDPTPIKAHENEHYVRIPLIYKDFNLHWRDVKMSKDYNIPLNVDNAIRAAHQVAHREDDLIFNGSKALGIMGLTNYDGIKTLSGGNWRQSNRPLTDVYKAIDVLIKENHHFPYALAVSLDMYQNIIKSVKDTPVMEIDQINRICSDGVYYSNAIKPKTAILVSTGPQNLDITVAEDLHISYLCPVDMNYKFRIYESLLLRVKRPNSICVIKSS